MKPSQPSPLRGPALVAGLLLILLSARASAQTLEEIPLLPPFPEKTPAATEEVVYRFDSLDDRGFNRAVRRVVMPTITVYHPAQPGHRRAALIGSQMTRRRRSRRQLTLNWLRSKP